MAEQDVGIAEEIIGLYTMEEILKKRRRQGRARNFTECDKSLLMKIASEYTTVIDNKKTDTTSVNMKKITWQIIADRFNSLTNSGSRNGKQMKTLYDVLKKSSTSPQNSNDRASAEIFSTGARNVTLLSNTGDDEILKSPRLQWDPLSISDSSMEYQADGEGTDVVKCGETVVPVSGRSTPESSNQDASTRLEMSETSQNQGNECSSQESNKRNGPDINPVDLIDSLVQRRLLRDKFDIEMRDRKMALVRKELDLKEKELENKTSEIEMAKKMRALEHEVKRNELHNVMLDTKIKEMELKIKTEQYSKLCNIRDMFEK